MAEQERTINTLAVKNTINTQLNSVGAGMDLMYDSFIKELMQMRAEKESFIRQIDILTKKNQALQPNLEKVPNNPDKKAK